MYGRLHVAQLQLNRSPKPAILPTQVHRPPNLSGPAGRPVDGRTAHAQEPRLQDHPGPSLPAIHREAGVQDQGGAGIDAADRGGAKG